MISLLYKPHGVNKPLSTESLTVICFISRKLLLTMFKYYYANKYLNNFYSMNFLS